MLEALGGAVLSAQLGHGLAVERSGNETQAFFHDRTLLPGYRQLPCCRRWKCYPCVRYDLSPMSRVAHISGFGLSVGGSWRARFELCCKPQTAIEDNAAALPLVVAKRFEFACELWHRQRLLVVHSAPGLVSRAQLTRDKEEPLDISRRSRTK